MRAPIQQASHDNANPRSGEFQSWHRQEHARRQPRGAAAAAGEKAIALDLDPQGSLANWGETRAAWCAADDLVVDHVDGARLTQLPQILAALSRFSIPQGSTALAATRCVPPHSAWYPHGRRGLIWR